MLSTLLRSLCQCLASLVVKIMKGKASHAHDKKNLKAVLKAWGPEY